MSSWRGHLAGGAVAWMLAAWLSLSFSTVLSPEMPFQLSSIGFLMLSILLAAVGSLFPDIDTDKSIIGAFFEKLFFLGVLVAIVYLLLFSTILLTFELKCALAVILAVLSYFFYTGLIDNHRTNAIYGLHAIKAAIAFSFGVFLLLSLLQTPEIERALLAGFFFCGYLSHLLLDGELHL